MNEASTMELSSTEQPLGKCFRGCFTLADSPESDSLGDGGTRDGICSETFPEVSCFQVLEIVER